MHPLKEFERVVGDHPGDQAQVEGLGLRLDGGPDRLDVLDHAARPQGMYTIALRATTHPGARVARQALELVGDVVIALRNSSTAHEIRAGLRKRILEIYDRGAPCYVLAHSLGSIYAFDVLNALIRDDLNQ